MKEIKGNLWDFHTQCKWICITTNGSLMKDGSLIMGAGCAGEAANRFPSLAPYLGWKVMTLGNHCFMAEPRIISFPTIDELYKDASTVPRVMKSAIQIKTLVDMYKIPEIYIPRPGCGIGGLDWERQVKPILQEIFTDDRFIIVSF